MPLSTEQLACPPAVPDTQLGRAVHTTCPPDEERAAPDNASRPRSLGAPHIIEAGAPVAVDPRHTALSPPLELSQEDAMRSPSLRSTPSPVPSGILDAAEKLTSSRPSPPLSRAPSSFSPPSLYPDLSYNRSTSQYTSSFLRSGSVFKGTQQSDHQKYNVTVEVKHVDMSESTMCGFLTIQGLTQDHPTLTTYFEGEIIGTKYSFQTRRPDWGSSDKVDMQHWNRFPAWRPLVRQARNPDFSYKDFADREDIFMRWKEYFLVPDHRVRTISGASFEGFYYICFNQKRGTVSGIYFHSKSEKFQQLELKHVDDRGCCGAVDFR